MLANCAECSRVFTPKPGLRHCYACSIAEQENYHKVYGYVLKRPGSSIEEVSEKTGVSKDAILKLMKQGRIQAGQQIRDVQSCNRCNHILSEAEYQGREGTARLFCRPCSKVLASLMRAQGQDPGSMAGLNLGQNEAKPGLHGIRHESRRYGIGGNR